MIETDHGMMFHISLSFSYNIYMVKSMCASNSQSVLFSFFLGATMVPVSWTEMQCPLTGQVEQRKVAKVAS